MASVPGTVRQVFAFQPCNFSSSSVRSAPNLPTISSLFVGSRKRLGWSRPTRIGPPSAGSRATCWFRFGKNGVDAEGAGIYGSQTRDDFDRDDVEQVVCFSKKKSGSSCCSLVLLGWLYLLSLLNLAQTESLGELMNF